MALNRARQNHLAGMLKDSANVILAAVVVSGFIERKAQFLVVAAGLVLYVVFAAISTRLRR